MTERSKHFEQPPSIETLEAKELSFETLRAVGELIDERLSQDSIDLENLRESVLEISREHGMNPKDIHFGAVELGQAGERGQIELSIDQPSASYKKRGSPSNALGLVAMAVVLAACPEKKPPNEDPPETRKTYRLSRHTDNLPDYPPGPSLNRPEELSHVAPPDCAAKPEHAPSECGVHQWQGFSETNPVAVSWLAIANTGENDCHAVITRLDLSYTDRLGNREILESGINGVQLLSDGTDGKPWGQYLSNFPNGSAFVLPRATHGYIHPFGYRAHIPEDAKELTVTFAVEIEGDCAVAGGIDTYAEWAFHEHGQGGYTQDGSPTDFVKEALKTPWITRSVFPKDPVSYSFPCLPRSKKETPEKELPPE